MTYYYYYYYYYYSTTKSSIDDNRQLKLDSFGCQWPVEAGKRVCDRSRTTKGRDRVVELLSSPTQFLSRVSTLTRDIYIAIIISRVSVSVRPCVCLSVTRWYCMKMA